MNKVLESFRFKHKKNENEETVKYQDLINLLKKEYQEKERYNCMKCSSIESFNLESLSQHLKSDCQKISLRCNKCNFSILRE